MAVPPVYSAPPLSSLMTTDWSLNSTFTLYEVAPDAYRARMNAPEVAPELVARPWM